jgi:hypothetical protein
MMIKGDFQASSKRFMIARHMPNSQASSPANKNDLKIDISGPVNGYGTGVALTLSS